MGRSGSSMQHDVTLLLWMLEGVTGAIESTEDSHNVSPDRQLHQDRISLVGRW